MWEVVVAKVIQLSYLQAEVGGGYKKNPEPRPRTALPRTATLEAKDRNARGQGPRTQMQVFSKKNKIFKKIF